jgi:nitroreductase
MEITAAVATRKSIRAFSDRPVSVDIVREILELSARAPSGSNLSAAALKGPRRDRVRGAVGSAAPYGPLLHQ